MDPTPGNHDWGNHSVGYDPYWRKVKGRPMPHHYAFSVGGWRIISVNSQTPRDREQLAFLRRELARVRGSCAIAFMHRPRFNAGMHRDEERDVDPLWQELRGKASILLSGHDHDLQRFKPVAGTVQYVIGAGGRSRYRVNAGDRRLAFSDDRTDGALRMRLNAGIARLQHRRRERRRARPLDRALLLGHETPPSAARGRGSPPPRRPWRRSSRWSPPTPGAPARAWSPRTADGPRRRGAASRGTAGGCARPRCRR